MRDGDVYSWRERGVERRSRLRTNVAIVVDGRLYDTYWMHHGSSFSPGSGGRGYGPRHHGEACLDTDRIETTLLGNIYEMEEIPPWSARDYRPEDVLDLRHPNNSDAPVYRRSDARPDDGVILERIRDEQRSLMDEISYLRRRLARLESEELETQSRLLRSAGVTRPDGVREHERRTGGCIPPLLPEREGGE